MNCKLTLNVIDEKRNNSKNVTKQEKMKSSVIYVIISLGKTVRHFQKQNIFHSQQK